MPGQLSAARTGTGSWRPSPGLALSTIALLIALGGQAAALAGKGSVRKGDIAAGAVTVRAIAPGAVRTAALAGQAVTRQKTALRAIDGSRLVGGSVDQSAFADDAVGQSVIAAGAVGGIQLKLAHVVPSALMPDPDTNENFAWTATGSLGLNSVCPGPERKLSGGLETDGGNERGFLQATLPDSNRSSWSGGVSTDSQGASPWTIYVLCLPR